MMTFGSLFAGIGGFDLGLERAGMRCAWQVEIDGRCRDVLSWRWPEVEKHGDVRERGADNLAAVDLICGGFPCQDVSVAGRRAGLAGERSGLWWEFRRVIEELRPRWCIVENVPGLLSSNGGADMGAILWALGELRYGWAYRVLDAQYFGLAQRRRRVFIVGCLGDARRAAQVLFEPESCERHTAPSRETGARVARAIARGAVSSGYRYDQSGEDFVVAPTLIAPDPNAPRRDGKRQDGSRTDKIPIVVSPAIGADIARQAGGHPGIEEYTNAVLEAQIAVFGFSQESDGSTARNAQDLARPVTGRHGDPGRVAYGLSENQRGEVRLTPYSRQLTTGGGKPGQGYPAVAFRTNQTGAQGPIHSEGITDTLAQDHPPAVAFTERTRDQGRTLEAQEELSYALTDPGAGGRSHCRQIAGGFGVRRLTPTECERLQGFPDGWTEGQSDSARYRQLGNAVAVPVAEWIGRRIMEANGDMRTAAAKRTDGADGRGAEVGEPV